MGKQGFRRLVLIAVALLCLALLLDIAARRPTAGGIGTADVVAKLDEPFTLAQKQTASIPSEGLMLTFVEAITDSRCPPGVQCVWTGEATILLTGSAESDSRLFSANVSTYFRNSTSMFSLTSGRNYYIKLLDLSRGPDYSATLRVSAERVSRE